MMSIMQRIGLHYDMNFLMGENHGGMAVNNRPFNLEKDCWIGKNDPRIKFSMSTNHLHYNKTAIDAVMQHPFVRDTLLKLNTEINQLYNCPDVCELADLKKRMFSDHF